MNYRPVIDITVNQKKLIKIKAQEINLPEKDLLAELIFLGYQYKFGVN